MQTLISRGLTPVFTSRFSRFVTILVIMLTAFNLNSSAQLTGTKNIPGDYATLAAAVTDLNTQGVGAGGVTFNLVASNPQTAPNGTGYYITATGTAANPIVFTGNSNTITAGANTAGGSMDAVFKIVGGDYITIQGFNIVENTVVNTVTATGATNTMTEAGVLLIHASATDGAQNNTIQNNTITLSSVYANAVGILSTSSSTTTNASPGANTTLDATSTAGTNSNNKVYGNTISSVAFGVMFICPPVTATVFETGNDVGGSALATGNTITYGNNTASTGPWNRSSTASFGITFRNGAGINIRFNTVNTIATLTVASTAVGVSSGSAPVGVTYTSTISDNIITMTNTGTTAITGIDFGHGLSTGTIVAGNNSVTINQNSSAANSAAIIGIKANYASASNTANANTVVINQSNSVGATTSAVTAITCAGTPVTSINVTNSTNLTIKQSVSGTGSFGSGAITFIDVNAGTSTTTSNATGNNINTTGSTIRSTGTLTGINQNTTIGLFNCRNNTFNVDRVAASGASTFTVTSSSPSEVADSIVNNSITFTNISGTSTVTAISSGGGPSSPTVTNKRINGNTISVSGTTSGTVIGITASFTNTGEFKNNAITVSTASNTITGFTSSSTIATVSGNTFNLSSSTTSGTAMTGITLSNSSAHTITNNTFSALNFTGVITGSPIVSAIALSGNNGANVSGHTITNMSVGAAGSTGSPILDGILISGGTSVNIFKNKIYGLTTNATGTGTTVNGIRLSGGTTNNVFNNLIGGLTAPAAASTDALRGISITATTASSTQNISFNSIFLNGSSTGANFGSSGIFHTISTTASTSSLVLRNNNIVNVSTPVGTGLTVAYRRSGGAASNLANYANTSNKNNFYAGTPGATNLIYSDGTSTAQTLAAYQSGVFTAGTVAPRDANSISENPTFLSTIGSSPDFLHVSTLVSTLIESGADPISGITDDYDGNARNATTPDIGADEFAGSSPAPVITFNSITPGGNQCTAAAHNVSVTVTTPAGTITAVTITYNNGTLNSNVAMTNTSGDIWEFSIPAASPGNTSVTWSVKATNSVGVNTTFTGTSYADEPLTGVTATATSNAVANTVCNGTAVTLTASLSKIASGTIGAGASTSAALGTSLFPGGWGGAKTQYLIRKSELNAIGLGAGNITSLSFTPTTAGQAYPGFAISMAHAASTNGTLSAGFVATTDVYAPGTSFTPTANVANTITFTTPFNWNGNNDIIVSICWSTALTTSTSCTVQTDAVGYNASYGWQVDSQTPAAVCGASGVPSGGNTPVLSTSRPKFTFTGNAAPAITSVTWDNGGGTGNPVTVTPSATTNYTATITALGCTTTAAVNITVNPLPTAPVAGAPSTQCGNGIPTVSVSDPNGFTTPTFKWYADNVTTTALQSSTSTTYTTAISSTTTFYVSVINPTTGCESARTPVTATVNTPDPVAASSDGPICLNSALNLTATVTAGTNGNIYTYTWSASPAAGSGIPTTTAGGTGTFGSPATTAVTPTAAGTYTYTVTAVDGTLGCTTSATVAVTVNPNPQVLTANATPNPVCSGSTVNLTATTGVIAASTAAIGAGATTSSASGVSMFSGSWGGIKTQYLILASELTAANITPGAITSLAFETSGAAGQQYTGFAVSIGHTTQTALAFPMVNTGLTQVYAGTEGANNGFTPATSAVNTLVFGTGGTASSFVWNGTDNIVLSFCFSTVTGATTSSTTTIKADAVSFVSSLYGKSDATLPAAFCPKVATTDFGTSGTATSRPRFVFGGQVLTDNTASNTFSWTTTIAGGTIANGATTTHVPSVTSVTTGTYTATATSAAGCTGSLTSATVTVNPQPTAPGTGDFPSVQCGTGIPSGFVTGTGTFRWYTVPTGGTALAGESLDHLTAYSISTTTNFYVSVFNGTCESDRTTVQAVVATPDPISASSDGPVCANSPLQLTATVTSGSFGNTYTYSWSASPATGSGIATTVSGGTGSFGTPATTTVTPTAGGTYTYTVTGTDGPCTSVATVAVVVKPQPSINTPTATPATICAGSSTQLAATSTGLAAGFVTLGAGANTSTLSTDGTPYRMGNTVGNQFKNQYLFLASELQSAGLSAGNITSIELTMSGAGGGTLSNFTIKMGTTAQTAMTSTYVTGLTTVFTQATYPTSGTVTTGLQTHVFNTPFNWDGTSNIVIEMCAQLATGGSAGTLAGDNLAFAATILNSPSTTACASATTGGGTSVTRPKVTFGGITATDITNTLNWSWNPGSLTGSTVTVSPTTTGTNTYTVTALNTTTNCSQTATVDVNVQPVPNAPIGSNSSQCGTGVPSASVTSGGGGAGIFKWYTVPSGGTAIPGETGTSLVSYTISTPTSFWVSEVGTNGCEGPRTQVDVTFDLTPDVLTLSASPSPICIGQSFTFSYTQTGGNNNFLFNYPSTLHSAGSGINIPNIDGIDSNLIDPSITITPTAAGTYTYTVRGYDPDKGCVSVATTTVAVNALPVITSATATPSTICQGASITLNGSTIIAAPGTTTLGAGADLTTLSTGGTPYRMGNTVGNQFKNQFLFLASELQAAGLQPGNITSIQLNMVGSGGGTLSNFTIKMGTTAQTTMTTTYVTGLTTVFTQATYPTSGTVTTGLQTHTFNTPFSWDGTSNIVVEMCAQLATGGSAGTLAGDNVGFASHIFNSPSTTACASATTGASTSNVRPQVTFGGTVGTNITGNLTWVWNNGAGTGSTVTTTPSTSGVINYNVTATDINGCSKTSSDIPVTVNPLPAMPTASDVSRCGAGSVTLTATGTGGTLNWYNVPTGGTSLTPGGNASYTTTVTVSGTIFYVAETSAAGCEGPRKAVTVTLTTAPTLVITPASATTFCLNGSVGLDAASASDPSYVNFTWSSNPSTGAGLSATTGSAITVQPTVAGTYTISVAADDNGTNGCASIATVLVTVNPNPVISSATANPATSCAGGNVSLSASTSTIAAGQGTIGTGTSLTGLTTQPTAFCNRWPSYRMQLLYTAAELQAAGLTAGNITSLAFNISSLGDADFNDNFRIKIGNTSLSTLTAFVDTTTGFTNVYNPKTYTHAVGLNTIPFDAPFNWNGTSNIIVQVVHLGADLTNNAETYYTATTGNTVAYTSTAETNGASLSTNRLNIVFGGQVQTTGAGSYNWQWSPGTLPAGNNITVQPTATTSYTVTATNPTTGCFTTSAPITVTILPVVAAASSTPAAICIGGSATLSASASTGGSPLSYAWRVQGNPTVLGSNATLTVTPTATTVYEVTVTDPCLNTSVATVTVTVNPLPTVSIVENGVTICSPATYTLTANTNAASPAYQWRNNSNNISGETASTYSVSATGNYSVRVTDGVTGCVNTTANVTVTVNPSPATVTVSPDVAICNGSNTLLTANGGSTTVSSVVTVGNTASTTTTSTAGITPYNSNWEGSRVQYLIRASELSALGLTAGNLTSLAFDVTALGSGTFAQSGFTIKIAHTNDAAFAGAYGTPVGSFTNVYGPVTQALPTLGTNTYTFTTPFNWDGTSNILIDICHDNDIANTCASCFSSSSTVRYTATAYNSTYGRYNDNAQACGANATSAATTFTNRPNMLIGGTSTALPTWSWTPSTGLSATNTASVTASPTVTTAYTARATNSFGCFKEATVNVTVNPVTVITVDAAPATQLVGQNTTATPLTVTATGTGTVTYQWFSNATNNNTGGTLAGTGASFAPSTATVGTLYYYAVASSDCGSATSSVVRVDVVNANTNFWTGNAGSNWSTPGSWSLGAVPTVLNDAVIPTGATPYPVLSATSTAKSLLIQSGATVSLNGQTLNIVQAVDPTGTGTFIGSNTSNLSVGATSTLRFGTGSAALIKNLTINGGTTTLATAVDVTGGTAINTYGTVTVASGAILASNGNLTFKSNAFGTARLASGASTGQWVTGDVTVERYIPGNAQRAWRFLSVPTKGNQTIKQSWQEGGTPVTPNPKPGYGTNITTPLTNYSAVGFDERTAKASMQFFNQSTGAWVDVNSTLSTGNVPKIESTKGYGIYIRGDRTQMASGAVTSTTPTTLRTTGTLYTGDQAAITIGANKFDLIGNTYVSAIDFLNLTRSGIANSFYLWDPKLVTGTPPNQTLGGYVTFSLANGWVGVPSNSSYGITPRTTIQSGEAFMIQAGTSGGTLTFRETSKSLGDGVNYFRPTNGMEKVKVNLYTVAADNTANMVDANVTVLDNAFSNAVDGDDAIKLSNAGENFAIYRENKQLVVEGRQPVTDADTTFFYMWNMRLNQQYKLEILTENMNIPGLSAYLVDDFTATTTPIDLASGSTVYNFNVPTSLAGVSNRFRIIYRQTQSGPLPVTFVSVSANRVGAGVKVDWKVAGERGIRQYEVERSADGIRFNSIGTVTAVGTSSSDLSYAWMDATPLTGNNFYRIKSVGVSGDVKYTYIVQVSMGNVKPTFTIAPNPVEGSVVSIQFRNQAQGRYAVRVLATTGEVIYATVAEHGGGNSTQLINLPASVARGTYQLEIISPDKTRNVQNLFINTLK